MVPCSLQREFKCQNPIGFAFDPIHSSTERQDQNEINSLGVKKIDDMELIRKILHSLWRPEYDLVITVIYEKYLDTLTPN